MLQSAVIRGWMALAAILAIVLLLSWEGASQERIPTFSQISQAAADSLARKINTIRAVEFLPERPSGQEVLTVIDVEIESFILYSMVDEIPPQVELIGITLDDGLISTDVELTMDEESSSGNAVVDGLLSGTHRLLIGGSLKGQDGNGNFELREVRLDGIPIPLFVVNLIVEEFVAPRLSHSRSRCVV